MSPVEHYFENLLTMGSDIKGDPNKNALSKEVQEAVETCANYAIDNMNKLQKIKQIFKDIEECPLVEDNALNEIKEIIEDGNVK